MAQVHADFVDLQDFQRVLQDNINRFTEVDTRTKGTLNAYEWQDPVAEKFKTEFEAGMKPILALTEQMKAFIPWLQARVDALMKYQGM